MVIETDPRVLQNAELGKILRRLLRAFNSSSDDIEASAIVSGDGLSLAWVLDDDTDPDRFGAMCASLLALANRAAQETSRGRLKQVLIEGQNGSMLLVDAGANAVLVVATKSTAKIGKIFIDVKRMSLKIATLMS